MDKQEIPQTPQRYGQTLPPQRAGLKCPQCGLVLNIDPIKSRTAIDALKKVQAAQENLENKSHFNR